MALACVSARVAEDEMSAGLDEALERLLEQKVNTAGMDSYTQEISKVCAARIKTCCIPDVCI